MEIHLYANFLRSILTNFDNIQLLLPAAQRLVCRKLTRLTFAAMLQPRISRWCRCRGCLGYDCFSQSSDTHFGACRTGGGSSRGAKSTKNNASEK